MQRKEFSRIEGIAVELRRMTPKQASKAGCRSMGANAVGIFTVSMNEAKNNKLVAVVDFDDIFDNEGNRFYYDQTSSRYCL